MQSATHYFHKITIPGRRSRYSAWWAGNPLDTKSAAVLVDAERIDSAGRAYPITDAEWQALFYGRWTARQSGTFNV
tara:strand:- start:8 stop:235 length:228 start_codon:yes stop_codon:yes gene_type:complete